MSRSARDRNPKVVASVASQAPPPVIASATESRSALQNRLRGLPADWLPLALIPGDALISGLSVLFGWEIRYGAKPASQALPLEPYLLAIPVVIAINLFAMAVNRQYTSWRGRALVDQLISLYSGIGLGAILMLAAIEVGNLGQHYSRLTIIPAVLAMAVLMTGERYLLRQYETRLRRSGIGTERVLMVGTGAESEVLIRRMNMFPQYGFHVVGVASDETTSDFVGAPVVGRVDDLPRLVRDLKVDQVFLALPGDQRDRLMQLVTLCEGERLQFKIVPDLLDLMSTRAEVNAIDGLPLIGIRRNQLRGGAAALKRAIDIAISAGLLLLLSPLLLVLVILMKVTMPGPILFRQERIGQGRAPFEIYKFRSMIPDAEAKTGPKVAKPGDERVTRLGRIMRRLSLDELPQLYNVLRGDMSLVGPRPQPTFFDERYMGEIPRYLERQQVRPGLTGWAEVNDLRGAAPIADRTMYDVYYIENWSLALDLKIVMLTAMRMFLQRHAY